MPRVSVIIPTYNRPNLLREALESVLSQTFRDFEIIVVDDGSTVSGIDSVCNEFPRCRYIRQQHLGRSTARNRGISEAEGDFVAFLDDDDLWKPEKLERQVAFLDQHLDIGLVHTPVEPILEDGSPTGRIVRANNPEWRSGSVFEYAVRYCIVTGSTPLIRREVFDSCGSFDPALHHGEDWDFWARIAYRYRFGFINKPLSRIRIVEGSAPEPHDELGLPPYIASKLCAFVEPRDRPIVRRQSCLAYLDKIAGYTSARSVERLRHSWRAFGLWPSCVFRRAFWRLLP